MRAAGVVAPLIRAYTRYSPLARGKLRLCAIGRRLCGSPPTEIVRLHDDRRLEATLSTGICDQIYFGWDYEVGVTRVVRKVVRPGDACLDVGAHFGWYATLMAQLAGPAGRVHAFEPLPDVFAWLERNLALLERAAPAEAVRAALAEQARDAAPVYLARGAPGAPHACLTADPRGADQIATAPVLTLGGYLAARGVGPVDVIKVDVEGAERAVLEGAEPVFAQPEPPLWIIEMSRENGRLFGYRPNDLLEAMRARAPHEFFAIDEQSGRLVEIDEFLPRDVGANVLCVPPARAGRLHGLKRRRRRPEDFSPDRYPGRFED